MAYPENDNEFYENVLEKVTDEDDHWAITIEGGTTWVPKRKDGFEPVAGMNARLYGRGFGYPVRGVFIDGYEFKYMTVQQQDDAHKKWVEDLHQKKKDDYENNKEEIAKNFNALPKFFQDRLQGFRDKDPDFIWNDEPYEMFCCEQAVVIADTLKGDIHKVQAKTKGEWEKYYQGVFREFMKASTEEQFKRVPGLSRDHTGNTFGGACNLAFHYLMTQGILCL